MGSGELVKEIIEKQVAMHFLLCSIERAVVNT